MSLFLKKIKQLFLGELRGKAKIKICMGEIHILPKMKEAGLANRKLLSCKLLERCGVLYVLVLFFQDFPGTCSWPGLEAGCCESSAPTQEICPCVCDL